MQIERSVWVTFQKVGFHRYPAAETDPSLDDVKFLAQLHRHKFHFKVEVSVVHNDRDIEFFQLQRELEGLYEGELEVDYKSCEMLAEDLIHYLTVKYPNRKYTVTVSEDGENGATLCADCRRQ